MLKLKLQYFGHLMQTDDSLENSLMLGTIAGRRKRGRQRMRCITNAMDMNLGGLWEVVRDREAWRAAALGVTELDTTRQLNNKNNWWHFYYWSSVCCLFLSGSFWVCLCVPSFLKFYDVPFSRSPVFNFHGHSLCTFRLNTYVLQCLEVLKAISLILSPQFNSSSLFGTSSKWWKDFLMSFFPLSYGLYVICIYFLTVSVLFYHSLTNIFHWAVFNFDKI